MQDPVAERGIARGADGRDLEAEIPDSGRIGSSAQARPADDFHLRLPVR
jgi:hypothetical protein